MLDAKNQSGEIVSANEALLDTQNEYKCPHCGAPMRVRSGFGAKAPHFYAYKGKSGQGHTDNCIVNAYDANIKNIPDSLLVKHPLDSILNRKAKEQASGKQISKSKQATEINSDERLRHISTPRTLLTWLSERKLTDTYLDGLTVDDIVLDYRNSAKMYARKIKGEISSISGLRMCSGKTLRFDCDHNWICFGIPEEEFPSKHVHVVCEFEDKDMFKHFVERIKRAASGGVKGVNKFKGVSIVVFGHIEKMKPYINPEHKEKNCTHQLLHKIIVKDRMQIIITRR